MLSWLLVFSQFFRVSVTQIAWSELTVCLVCVQLIISIKEFWSWE